METININDVDNIEFDCIDHDDYPDFSDSFISSADYKGMPMAGEQLDILNEDSDFVYAKLINYLF